MNNLKEARKKARMTQKEVAQHIGISQNTYSYWENGRNNIDSESIHRLADLFNVSTDYLLGRDISEERASIAKGISQKRGELKLTQDDLAKILDVSTSTIRRYETPDAGQIPANRLGDIADALDTTVATLSGYEEEEKKAESFADVFTVLLRDEELLNTVLSLLRVKENSEDSYRNLTALIKGMSK